MRNFLIFCLLVSTPLYVWAQELQLKVSTPPEGESQFLTVGKLNKEGMGELIIKAKRRGEQLFIQALNDKGQVVGKAGAISGLQSSALYIRHNGQLSRVNLIWSVSE